MLQAAGCNVTVGVLEEECKEHSVSPHHNYPGQHQALHSDEAIRGKVSAAQEQNGSHYYTRARAPAPGTDLRTDSHSNDMRM